MCGIEARRGADGVVRAAVEAWAAAADNDVDVPQRIEALQVAVSEAASAAKAALEGDMYACGSLEQAGWLANDGARWAAAMLKQASRALASRGDGAAASRNALSACAQAVASSLDSLAAQLGQAESDLEAALGRATRAAASDALPDGWNDFLERAVAATAKDQAIAAGMLADSLTKSAGWCRGVVGRL